MEWGVMTLGEGAWQGEESWRGRGFRVMTGVLRMVSASAVMNRDSRLTNRDLFLSCVSDPASGIWCLFDPWNPGWVKSQDPDPG
jgi:hypothetical protein